MSPHGVDRGLARDVPPCTDPYRETFERRGALYNRAMARQPRARDAERDALLTRLELGGARRICDLPAGGGYLTDGIAGGGDPGARVVAVEPSARFASGIRGRHPTVVAPLHRLPFADGMFDRVGSLAGIHHLEDKEPFYAEAARVLAPGGRVCVADVGTGSPAAAFLNDAVDRLTETGHRGLFLAPGALHAGLARAGLAVEHEEALPVPWRFPDRAAMAAFCRELFGMVRASEHQVLRELEAALDIRDTTAGVEMGWSLVYAVALKAALPGAGRR